MAYNKTLWQNNSLPAINEGNLNKIEQGIYETHENIGNINDLQYDTNLVGAINSIIESGSNENGNWIKYVDGTMICTKTISITTPITSPWGALFESGDVILGQFPQTFISNPRVSVTNNSSSGVGALIEAVFGVTTTSAGKCWLCRGTSRDSQVPYVLDIIAIGKWK